MSRHYPSSLLDHSSLLRVARSRPTPNETLDVCRASHQRVGRHSASDGQRTGNPRTSSTSRNIHQRHAPQISIYRPRGEETRLSDPDRPWRRIYNIWRRQGRDERGEGCLAGPERCAQVSAAPPTDYTAKLAAVAAECKTHSVRWRCTQQRERVGHRPNKDRHPRFSRRRHYHRQLGPRTTPSVQTTRSTALDQVRCPPTLLSRFIQAHRRSPRRTSCVTSSSHGRGCRRCYSLTRTTTANERNSIQMYLSQRRQVCPTELHVYATGGTRFRHASRSHPAPPGPPPWRMAAARSRCCRAE